MKRYTINNSLLRKYEASIILMLIKFVPKSIGTKTLTNITLVSSVLAFLSYFLAGENLFFLHFASLFILMQWIFDCLDGAVGRLRNEGFVRWGYYMDHFYDFVFISGVIFGLMFLFSDSLVLFIIVYFLSVGFMVSFFLAHNSKGENDILISFGIISPIEIRIFFIFLNTITFFMYDVIYKLLNQFQVIIISVILAILIFHIYVTQKQLSNIDRSTKD